MIDMYGRYKENIDLMDFPEVKEIDGNEIGLLLGRPSPDLGEALERIHGELRTIKTKIMDESTTKDPRS